MILWLPHVYPVFGVLCKVSDLKMQQETMMSRFEEERQILRSQLSQQAKTVNSLRTKGKVGNTWSFWDNKYCIVTDTRLQVTSSFESCQVVNRLGFVQSICVFWWSCQISQAPFLITSMSCCWTGQKQCQTDYTIWEAAPAPRGSGISQENCSRAVCTITTEW